MDPPLRTTLESLVVFLFGLLPAFFVVFTVVFSDAFGFGQHALGVGYPLVAYLVLGFLVGILTRTDARLIASLLVAPAVLLLVWYAAREPDLLYQSLVLLAALVGTYGGTFLGRRFQRPHGPSAPAQ